MGDEADSPLTVSSSGPGDVVKIEFTNDPAGKVGLSIVLTKREALILVAMISNLIAEMDA
jgi:hypothetical protein